MSTEIEALLQAALELSREEDEGASDRYWLAVAALHSQPVQSVFDRCLSWCSSARPAERRLGADILGQLGCIDRSFPFRTSTIPVLKALLTDTDAEVTESALIAFSHLGARESVSEIVALAQHPKSEVRYAVAFALLGDESEVAVDTLIRLSGDLDADVRDWSTFALGAQIDIDTPAIREALLARAYDPDPDTRSEALSGLVKRRDSRVIEPLRRALESGTVGSKEVEAARDLGSRELLEALEKLSTWWGVDAVLLQSAILRCRGAISGAG
jgi:hypothetical protein